MQNVLQDSYIQILHTFHKGTWQHNYLNITQFQYPKVKMENDVKYYKKIIAVN